MTMFWKRSSVLNGHDMLLANHPRKRYSRSAENTFKIRRCQSPRSIPHQALALKVATLRRGATRDYLRSCAYTTGRMSNSNTVLKLFREFGTSGPCRQQAMDT